MWYVLWSKSRTGCKLIDKSWIQLPSVKFQTESLDTSPMVDTTVHYHLVFNYSLPTDVQTSPYSAVPSLLQCIAPCLSLKSKLGTSLCFGSPDRLPSPRALIPSILVLTGIYKWDRRQVEDKRNHEDTSQSFEGFEQILPTSNTQGFQHMRFIVDLHGYRQVCLSQADWWRFSSTSSVWDRSWRPEWEEKANIVKSV